jgi:molecular chaperone DnaK (HSP70)
LLKLTLKTERLAELTTDELNAVGGAARIPAVTTEIRECLHTVFGCTTNIYCP